ncbi:L-serine ammonia-lyase [Rhabdochlamydiaceae symbiont of Dictyostelium giganteum]|uniref:L-serine ammonia-lyase n=1 Tax=Rhabdochlamydiaceae symbiont of Dictyostelium giganteum TaxID=3342349 RepID=UPI003850E5B3
MVSLFQLFSIGIGPSSSHTVGPMRAARLFGNMLKEKGTICSVKKVTVELYGSLAMTGIGHGTDKAVLLGLEGETPEDVDPDIVEYRTASISQHQELTLMGEYPISFDTRQDLIFHKGKRLPYHSNALRFKAFDLDDKVMINQLYYSVGGGFVVSHEHLQHSSAEESIDLMPYPFKTYQELLQHCEQKQMMIHDIVMENEKALRPEHQVREGILRIWEAMNGSIERGFFQEGILPGGLEVKRRAPGLYQQLSTNGNVNDPTEFMDWVSLFALSVNEENAAGGRVVTAPTNGAAGVIPAVLRYYLEFTPNPTEEGIIRFFLTATAMGTLYKLGASISAAEMGCQGEIGVACSMAAAGLTSALNGTNGQIENAAEIGMEHHLGLTCDPVAGLVQIPCIERNTMGAIQAITSSKLALRGDGTHRVSLDQVIKAMRQTGEDMKGTYKETSEAGLALHVPVNVPEC